MVTAKPIRLGLASPQKRVMVLYPRASSAYDVSITKIFNVFEDKLLDVEVSIVNFKLNDAVGEKLLKQADTDGYDLIFGMGSESTAWLYANYKGGKLPVVSICSKDPVVLGQSPGYDRGSGNNFAFTSLNMPMDVQMAYVNELKPKLRNIAVLVDSRNLSAVETQSKPVIEYAKKRGMRVLELAVNDPANAQAELVKLVSSAADQMKRNDPDQQNSLFWLTGSTSVFKEIDTINKYAGRIPVLAVVPEIVREGDSTPPPSRSASAFESNAHLAAIYSVDILNGRTLKRASELRVGVVSPPDIALSFRKIARHRHDRCRSRCSKRPARSTTTRARPCVLTAPTWSNRANRPFRFTLQYFSLLISGKVRHMSRTAAKEQPRTGANIQSARAGSSYRFAAIHERVLLSVMQGAAAEAIIDQAVQLIEDAIPGCTCLIEFVDCGLEALRSSTLSDGGKASRFDISAAPQTVLGVAFNSAKPVEIGSFVRETAWAAHGLRAVAAGYASAIALPLVRQSDRKTIGAVALYCDREDAFDTAHTEHLASLAANHFSGAGADCARQQGCRAGRRVFGACLDHSRRCLPARRASGWRDPLYLYQRRRQEPVRRRCGGPSSAIRRLCSITTARNIALRSARS